MDTLTHLAVLPRTASPLELASTRARRQPSDAEHVPQPCLRMVVDAAAGTQCMHGLDDEGVDFLQCVFFAKKKKKEKRKTMQPLHGEWNGMKSE